MSALNIDERFLPRWFNIWFYASSAVFFVGGIADQLSGKTIEGFNPWGAALGTFILYLLTLCLWRKRHLFRSIVSRVSLPLVLKSVLIGWLFAEIDELVNFPFNPLFPGVSLLQDVIFTTPFYLLVHLGWFWVLRKYKFTAVEALITGGLTLGFFELFGGGINPLAFLGFIVFPFVVMIHGVHMVMPQIALEEEFVKREQKETKWKYLWGVLIPGGCGLLGVGVMLLLPLLLG